MKKIITNPPIRALGIILMLLWSLGIKAQTPNTATLTWDQEVGCIRYEDEVGEEIPGTGESPPQTHVNLIEGMMDGNCPRFCEGSRVSYTLQGSNIIAVQWQVTGGTLQPGSNNTNAIVQWGSSGNGSLTVTITYADNTVKTYTVCIEKIVSPHAEFQIDGPDPHQYIFCTNTLISFKNISHDNGGSSIVNYLWDFGDGNFSNAFEPTHTYTSGGGYAIRLLVTNSCNCTSEYAFEVNVEDAEPIEIVCQNVTCEGNWETYSTTDGCPGEWEVIGGTIVGGGSGNPFVDVVWDQVDPADGFGYVSYSSHCQCPHWTTVKIPVVLRHAELQGPTIICQGKQAKYSLPQWPTTDFKWRLNGDPNHPMIVYTDQRNEIIVDGMAPGTYYIDVEYRNTLLGTDNCAGRIEGFAFEVVENVSIIAPENRTICTGLTYGFDSSNGQPVYWEIRMGGNVVHSVTAPGTSYTFNTGGTYVVTATNNGCISDPVVIEVIPTPVITAGITGPNRVCLDVPYIYSIGDDDPGAIFVWSVTGGDVIGSNAGNEVAIAFNTPTATVTVVKQYIKNGVICTSAPVNYSVSEVVVNPTIINDSGLSMFCPSNQYTFTVDLGGVDVDHLEWKLTPPNFGSIISGVNSGTVTIALNEVSLGITTGNLVVEATKCGNKEISVPFQINLIDNISLDIEPIDPICPGTSSFDVEIASLAPGGIGTLVFLYDDINPYTVAYSGPGIYNIPQNFNNPSNSASIGGNLTVRLVDPFGCKTTVIANRAVTILPQTTVEIFNTSLVNTVCPSNGFSINLQSTFSTGVTSSDTFNWYHDNNLLPSAANGPGMTTLQLTDTNGLYQGPGEYYVQVTDVNGCLITSNKIRIFESCSPGGPGNPGGSGCNLGFDPIPNLTYNWLPCGTVNLNAVYNTVPANIANVEWESLTIGATLGTFNDNQAQFSINNVGLYDLKVKVRYHGCPDTFETIITVRNHYQPILRYVVTCMGGNSYNIDLKNNSKMFDIDPSLVNIAYFDAANNPLGSGQSALVTGVGPGTHTYKMVLSTTQTTENGTPIPDCEVIIQVEIQGPPPTTFTIAPTQYCAEEPIMLTLPSAMLPGYRYEWHYLDTHYVAAGLITQINISTAGQRNIKLRIYNQYDCMFESDNVPVDIFKAEFFGTVAPNSLDFCEGSTVTPLQFQPNPFTDSPTNAIWMRDNVQVATGLTYTPTQSGSYWPILIDGNNCKFYGMVNNPAIVTMRKPPFASINGNTSVCYGESTTLTGIYTDPNVEHRWVGTGLPGGYNNWVTGNTNLTLTLSGLPPGSHTYAFETRLPADTSCVNSFEAVVVFHPQLFISGIGYSVVDCNPYTLELTAGGPADGTYNWSNGMTGHTIYVTHGGAYSVTYTAPTGCSITTQVQTPHNPERTLWIVPKGCYSICASLNPYLLAPFGMYEQYEWIVNGGTSQIGNNTFVPNQMVNQPGEYQLAIGQFGCMFYSNKPHIDLDYGCRTPNSKPAKKQPQATPAELTVSPNPATETAVASFNVGTQYQHATGIAVYDVTGVQRLQQKVTDKQGEVQLNISHLSPGTYIVNLQADGVNIAQQKLIKK